MDCLIDATAPEKPESPEESRLPAFSLALFALSSDVSGGERA